MKAINLRALSAGLEMKAEEMAEDETDIEELLDVGYDHNKLTFRHTKG